MMVVSPAAVCWFVSRITQNILSGFQLNLDGGSPEVQSGAVSDKGDPSLQVVFLHLSFISRGIVQKKKRFIKLDSFYE